MKSRQGIENRDAELPNQKYIGTTPVEADSSIARGQVSEASERSVDHESSPPPVEPVPPVDEVHDEDGRAPVKAKPAKGKPKK
jgi:hypothetical protein